MIKPTLISNPFPLPIPSGIFACPNCKSIYKAPDELLKECADNFQFECDSCAAYIICYVTKVVTNVKLTD